MKFRKDYLEGGRGFARFNGGDTPFIGSVINALSGYTLAEAKAHPRTDLVDGMLFNVDGAIWRYAETSELDGDDKLVVELTTTSRGRLLRQPGPVTLTLPFTYATADDALLYEVPDGAYMMPLEFMWGDITTGFSGGSSSAIGVSSHKTGFTTAGDLLGGAAGDVAATLVAGTWTPGTIGAKFDTLVERRVMWGPGDDFRLDRVTSAFTAGVGAVKVIAHLLTNAGA